MAITAGQLLAAIQGVGQLGVDTSSAASLNLANLPADAVIGEDVLSVVAVFWPPAALLEAALAVAVVLAPMIGGLIASGAITPGTSMEGQTQRAFNPGDPAARLVD